MVSVLKCKFKIVGLETYITQIFTSDVYIFSQKKAI